MLSYEQLWSAIEAYNIGIFPAQFVLLILGIVFTVWLLIKPDKLINIIVKAYFAFCFALAGIVLFLLFVPGLLISYLMSLLLLAVAALFFVDIFWNKIEFRRPERGRLLWITILFLFLIFLYPVAGMLVGHHYPASIMLGALPCPSSALALVLLAAAIPRVMRTLYILLLLDAVPFPLLLIPLYGVFEDLIMFAAGVFALIMLIVKWKDIEREQAKGTAGSEDYQ